MIKRSNVKICFVLQESKHMSGWSRYANDLIAGARERGFETTQVALRGARSFWGVVSLFFRTIYLARDADILYAIDGWPYGVVAWCVASLLHKKLIIGAIGTYTIAPFYRWSKRFVARAYTCADIVIAISKYTRRRLLEHVPDARVVVITPGIAFEYWMTNNDSRRLSAKIISVGSVKSRKGYHVALEAFAIARKSVPGLRWTIVGNWGDRSYCRALKDRARELGVADAIGWYDGISDVDLEKLYKESSLFILLSENRGKHFEGFGIVFLEAAAAGLPVIGTRDNGIEDAIGPENGILVSQHDAQAAADAILIMLANEKHWHEASWASRIWAQSHTRDTMYAKLEKIYDSVCCHD